MTKASDQALERCLDVLLRMYPDVVKGRGVEQATDTEMDMAIVAAATALHGVDTRQWPAPLTTWLRGAAYQTRH